MSSTLITAPAAEPLSLVEAKSHLRADGTDEDALISSLIAAAREQVQTVTRRALVTQTWSLKLDSFPALIEVPRPPLITVASITYVDVGGDTQTLAASRYTVDADSEPGRIVPVYGDAWPATRSVPNAVTVQFDAGYGAAADVPQPIKQAMLLLIGHWYEHREAVNVGNITNVMPMAVESLLFPYRVLSF